ncbi:MAG: hypothetical protein ACKO6Q_04335 [Bacteroidota bacterium]
MSTYLFAIDINTKEVIVSVSAKGSNKIEFIERIPRQKQEELYQSVMSLMEQARAANFDEKKFKAMDKVCQALYRKHKGVK